MAGAWRVLWVVCAMLLAGCAAPQSGTDRDIDGLARAIREMDPSVDAAEATRAARISYSHSHELALAYQITDPPLVHNTKVNMGLKPRGLCWHWAEDMEKRLRAEGFVTLRIHRAIANHDNPMRIDHSTAVVSARGAGMSDGIVLDPWRRGGRLYWGPVQDDRSYDWKPQQHVLAQKYGLIPVAQAY